MHIYQMHNARSVNRNCLQGQPGCNSYIKNRRREQLCWARARFTHARLVRVLVRVASRVNSRNQAASSAARIYSLRRICS